MIVYTTLLIPQSILFEAALSYLGLGVPCQTASWGGLLNDAQRYYDVAWWLMLFPGLFLVDHHARVQPARGRASRRARRPAVTGERANGGRRSTS